MSGAIGQRFALGVAAPRRLVELDLVGAGDSGMSGLEGFQGIYQLAMFFAQRLEALPQHLVVLLRKHLHPFDFLVGEFLAIKNGGPPRLADDAPHPHFAAPALKNQSMVGFAIFQVNNIVFPIVAAEGSVGGVRGRAQEREDACEQGAKQPAYD